MDRRRNIPHTLGVCLHVVRPRFHRGLRNRHEQHGVLGFLKNKKTSKIDDGMEAVYVITRSSQIVGLYNRESKFPKFFTREQYLRNTEMLGGRKTLLKMMRKAMILQHSLTNIVRWKVENRWERWNPVLVTIFSVCNEGKRNVLVVGSQIIMHFIGNLQYSELSSCTKCFQTRFEMQSLETNIRKKSCKNT